METKLDFSKLLLSGLHVTHQGNFDLKGSREHKRKYNIFTIILKGPFSTFICFIQAVKFILTIFSRKDSSVLIEHVEVYVKYT